MKRNFKAHLALALAAALALSLTACGPKDTDTSKSESSGSASASQSQGDVSGTSSAQKEEPTPTPDPEPEPPAPSPAEESLDAIRMEMEPSGAIAAVFFLGVNEGEPLDEAFYSNPDRAGYFEGRPFMKEIPKDRYIQTAGTEVYCIVPADPFGTVKVTEWDESVEPVAGNVLYESSNGSPIFVQGNVSDIMPNLSITITNRFGHTLEEFHPYISLKDGSVALPDGDQLVLDMTGSMTAVDPYAN